MLPLWIIDLQQDRKRSERLQNLISSLRWREKAMSEDEAKSGDEPVSEEETKSIDTFILPPKYWMYTWYENHSEQPGWFQGFVDKLVEDGQAFVQYLNAHNPVNDPCINVCVLGDASELFSLTIFSAVAAIIKREKSLIIPDHVQQGINVLGMLYVPSTVNTLPYLQRQGVLRCLKELQVQRKVGRSGSYDKVMLYQDTQHRTEKFYPLLTPEQQVDYVFQCLVHLYYVCDSIHPLLDGSNANDDFYFSMGAGSLYYSTDEQDDSDKCWVGNSLTELFKKKGYSSVLGDFPILDSDISPIALLEMATAEFQFDDYPNPRSILKDCSQHPVNDFASLLLKRRFYGDYLQHYVEEYQKQVIRRVAHSSQESLLKVNDLMRDIEEKVKQNIDAHIPQLIRRSSEEVGSLMLIDAKLGELGQKVKTHKIDLKNSVEQGYWHKIEESLPNLFKDAFLKYHDKFLLDSDKAVAHPECDELKKETVKQLTGHLMNDATVLSRMVRAFLAGVVSVLGFMPVLETISPRLINIGDVAHHPFFYAFTLFLLPAVIEAIRFWRYHRKRKRLENEIVAYYLHDSYARLANRLYNKVNQLYDFIIHLIEKYKERCNWILEDKEKFFRQDEALDLCLPKTLFNQPVIGGKCCGRKIFMDDQQNHNSLQIDVDRVRMQKMTLTQQYFLINKFSDQFAELFKDVVVKNKVLDPDTNEEIVLSKEEIPVWEKKMYQDAKLRFEKKMKENIKSLFIKREDSTVGEKLDLYRKSAVNALGFDLFCRFNATNGEFTANDNESFADIKSNSSHMRDAFGPFLPLKTTYQVIEEGPSAPLFENYLFLTRWRTFNYITASRVLPEIELDDKDFRIKYGFDDSERIPVASIVLYSILGNLSSEWYTLFDTKSIDQLQIRLHDRKKATWRELEEEYKAENKELEEGTIPYYDKILDPKVD